MEQEGKIVGFVCAHGVGFRGYLSALVVSATVRGQGIGSELLGGVEAALSRRGCTMLISDVWRDAEVFYRHLGWSQPNVVLLRQKLAWRPSPATGHG
jgi:GNAT superfamily N-acetyltransferase